MIATIIFSIIVGISLRATSKGSLRWNFRLTRGIFSPERLAFGNAELVLVELSLGPRFEKTENRKTTVLIRDMRSSSPF